MGANEEIILQPGPRAAERDLVNLYAQFTNGAATPGGTNSVTYTRRLGISSVAWTAKGKLRVTLLRPYAALVDCRVYFKVGATQKGWSWEMNAEDVDGNTTPYVDLLVTDGGSPPVLTTPPSISMVVVLTVQDAKD